MAGDCYCCYAACSGGSPSTWICAWGEGNAASQAASWISSHCGGSGGSISCGHHPDEDCE